MIPFPVYIIPFPVSEKHFGFVGPNGVTLAKEFFDPMTGKGRNNSIFWLDNSISCF
jgi:hypothetical protein